MTLTPARIEEFLLELVSLSMEADSLLKFARKFQDFDLSNERIVFALLDKPIAQGFFPVDEVDAATRLTIPYVRAITRGIWVHNDVRTREGAWIIFRADLDRRWWREYEQLSEWWLPDSKMRVRLPPAAPELPIETACAYLLKNHSRAGYCSNDQCPQPYFLAKRPTQRYCSQECSAVGEKEVKRRWWAEHGSEWRRKRNEKAEQGNSQLGSVSKNRKRK